jgi:hypothetical protein
MSQTSLDIRQSQTRVLQDQIDSATVTQMDSVLASVNNELTPPGRLIAASTPSLVVTVGSGSIVNPNTSKSRVLPFINNAPVSFTGGTITFPSTSGTITVSPGTNATITIGASQFVAVLVQLNVSGQLNLVVGTAAGSLGAVVIPSGSTTSLSLGYIIVQSNGSSVIQNVTNAMLYQFVGGGGSGSGTSGTGDDLDALQYQSDVTELFSNSPTAAASLSTVDTTQSNATYSAANSYMVLSYDASNTVTGTGTSMTLSGTPSYTVAVGDILRVGTQARKITVVTTQTSYTIEAAFSTNPTAAAATVSQAVYSKDLNNFAFNGDAISAIYTGTISDCLVTYNDTSSGTNYNYTDPSLIAYTASADGSNYTTVQSREANPSLTLAYTSLPSTSSNMYLRFFSNASSGTGTVNLTNYKAFFHRLSQTEAGGVSLQAYCFTNSVGTPVGCSNPTIVNGKTQIVLNSAYPVGVNSGFTNGALTVFVNGQKIPRFVNSTLTPDASFTEINATTIQLDQNYSSVNYSVEVYQYVAVVDSNTQNTTSISILQTVPTIQIFNQSNYYTFTITAPSSAVSAGAVFTNNGSSFTVVYAITTSGTTLVAYRSSGTNAPASSGTLTYSSGTGPSTITFSAVAANGTYQLPTSPNKPRFLKIKMVGAGGGGGGSGTVSSGGTGTSGTSTTFGTSLLTCTGGTGGGNTYSGFAGNGGSATINSPAIGFGYSGQTGGAAASDTSSVFNAGGGGGNSVFFNGGGLPTYNAGQAGNTNTGGGGGGAGTNLTAAFPANGGGSGGYLEAIISNPSTSYTYSVGSGGSGGTAGTSGFVGGAGALGTIIIEEWY